MKPLTRSQAKKILASVPSLPEDQSLRPSSLIRSQDLHRPLQPDQYLFTLQAVKALLKALTPRQIKAPQIHPVEQEITRLKEEVRKHFPNNPA